MERRIWTFLKSEIAASREVDQAFADYNAKRIRVAGVIAIPISLAMIVLFLFFTSTETPVEWMWSRGIAIAHGSLVVAELVLVLSSIWYLRHPTDKLCGKLIEFFGILIVLIAGTAITMIDQLVLTSITPFLIATTVAGAIFRIRPYKAAVLYSIMLFVVVGLMPLVQADPNAIQSNIVNAIFAVFIGFLVNTFVYRSSREALLSRRDLNKNQTLLEGLNRQLDYLASHDDLTGLRNRRSFLAAFEANANDASALVLFDLDRFKTVNDTFGHPAGDKLLQACAKAIGETLTPTETFARWGGEEFILLLERTTIEQALARAETWRAALCAICLVVGDQTIQTSGSFGVTMVRMADAKPFDRAYHRADQALYQAKQSGRNKTAAL